MAKKKLNLKVVFDTNAIFTGSASDLFKKEIGEIIESHSKLNDIEIDWYLPEVVIKERIFQMTKKGNEFLPAVQKLEKLFGHGLNINKELIDLRVKEAVKKQTDKYNVKTILMDVNKVKWDKIIHSALFRHPPFEDNEKEKGFRDSLILECFKQLIDDSPSTKSICRIVFITNDGLLFEAASQFSKDISNSYIFNNLDELTSLINILASEITEDLINQVVQEANSLFFTKEDKTSLYYVEDVRKRINDEFSKELNYLPEGAEIRENGTWWINKPGFEKKEKQRIHWKTIVEVEFETFKNIFELGTPQTLAIPEFLKTKTFTPVGSPNFQVKKEKIGGGRTRFEINWTVTLTTTKKLKSPKIESVKYLDLLQK